MSLMPADRRAAAPITSPVHYRPTDPERAQPVRSEQGNPPEQPTPASQPSQPAPREASPAELEFIKAMQDYKAASGRMFPTWSEVLEVLKGLGYEKIE
jgi:hypothetical protein